MAIVKLRLPAVLVELCGGEPSVELSAGTAAQALEALFNQRPELRVHLLDESQRLRPHVMFLVNGENSRWWETLDRALAEGDELVIMQAVSGG